MAYPGLEEFAEIVKSGERLAPYTYLKLGGPADLLVQPRSRDELFAVVRRLMQLQIPVRVLGNGCQLLVRDEGVRGAVLRLQAAPFTQISVNGRRVRTGAGAALSALISATAALGLTGLEMLVGIPGTVGGALRHNAGDKSGEIGPYVQAVEVVDNRGEAQIRERDELRFAYRWSNLDEPVILGAELDLEPDQTDVIVKRLRKAWILRKANRPPGFQAAVRLFRDPRGLSAAALITQAGLAGTRVGGAELSERDSNFLVANPGATAHDVLRLIDLVRSRVRERFHVELELELTIW